MTEQIAQYAQRYRARIEAALVGACPRAVIGAEEAATMRYATHLATCAVELAGGAVPHEGRCEDAMRPNWEIREACEAECTCGGDANCDACMVWHRLCGRGNATGERCAVAHTLRPIVGNSGSGDK